MPPPPLPPPPPPPPDELEVNASDATAQQQGSNEDNKVYEDNKVPVLVYVLAGCGGTLLCLMGLCGTALFCWCLHHRQMRAIFRPFVEAGLSTSVIVVKPVSTLRASAGPLDQEPPCAAAASGEISVDHQDVDVDLVDDKKSINKKKKAYIYKKPYIYRKPRTPDKNRSNASKPGWGAVYAARKWLEKAESAVAAETQSGGGEPCTPNLRDRTPLPPKAEEVPALGLADNDPATKAKPQDDLLHRI